MGHKWRRKNERRQRDRRGWTVQQQKGWKMAQRLADAQKSKPFTDKFTVSYWKMDDETADHIKGGPVSDTEYDLGASGRPWQHVVETRDRRDGDTLYFDGAKAIDNLAVYDRELTDREISGLFAKAAKATIDRETRKLLDPRVTAGDLYSHLASEWDPLAKPKGQRAREMLDLPA